MADNNNIEKNDISLEEQEIFGQLVTEALMREKMVAPDADTEWNRMRVRLSGQSNSSSTEEDTETFEEAEERKFSLRAMWTVVGTVAAIALVVVLLNIKGLQADNDTVFQAKAAPADIVILDANNKEQTFKGNEMKLASSSQVEEHTVVVPEGKDMKITLADGTVVWLNANSRLTYPTAFSGKERRVSLQGEGYFKVSHDAHHPFIVKTGDMQTRVLGTEFDINASDASHPHVTLVQGSVKVCSSHSDKVIVPGEDASIDAQGEIKVAHVEVDDVACWREGVQLFDNVPLRDILVQMGSWYNVSVVCHDDAILNARLRYMYDRKQSLEEAVKMLNSITRNKVELYKNTILIQ